jgi:hypothetical protein
MDINTHTSEKSEANGDWEKATVGIMMEKTQMKKKKREHLVTVIQTQ